MKDRSALTSERQTRISRKSLEYLSNNPWMPGDAAEVLAIWACQVEDTMAEFKQLLDQLSSE